jgi:hypothetical protein
MSLARLSCIRGPLLDADATRLTLRVVLCALRPALIAKGTVGRHHRAVSRNGRVLLASAAPLDGLAGQTVRLNVSVWHRATLPGDQPEPFGVLLAAWPERGPAPPGEPCYHAVVTEAPPPDGALHIDLGGLRILTLVPADLPTTAVPVRD